MDDEDDDDEDDLNWEPGCDPNDLLIGKDDQGDEEHAHDTDAGSASEDNR